MKPIDNITDLINGPMTDAINNAIDGDNDFISWSAHFLTREEAARCMAKSVANKIQEAEWIMLPVEEANKGLRCKQAESLLSELLAIVDTQAFDINKYDSIRERVRQFLSDANYPF